jgi:serine/threonine-protein kinase HipA
MGALEFEPAMPLGEEGLPHALVLRELVESARRAIRGELAHVAPNLIQVGTSAGGARAKAVIGFNPATQEITSGQFELPPGFEHWLLKFDGVTEEGELGPSGMYGRIEYAYWMMATAAGIEMSDCRLIVEGPRAHFMTRRFDREGNRKVHMQSLCALAHLDFNIPYVYDYEEYLRAILQLRLGASALEQAFRRMAFNVIAKNCDDHTKNLAFLMDTATGAWRLAPAYDVSFAHNPAPDKWTRQHQMLVNGKARGITRGDLLAVARTFSLKGGAEILEQVESAVAYWPALAWSVELDDSVVSEIQRYHGLSDGTR